MQAERTGAHLLIEALLAGGVEVCFANPGTSEMHLVAALDDCPAMKQVLCLFEGVVTGAADGYARMAGRPAATLLHLGPGLANGLASIHNARKAGTGMVNIIGDHTTLHKRFDAPLNSDIEATARPYSHWVRTSETIPALAEDIGKAISVASGGGIATLIVPADLAWTPTGQSTTVPSPLRPARATDEAISAALSHLANGKRTGLILGGTALYGEGLRAAGRIAAATGATLLAPYASSRIERGAGLPETVRIPFPVDAAVSLLAPFNKLVLVGSQMPVAFFAYPGKPSEVVPRSAEVLTAAATTEDAADALARMAAELGEGTRRNDAPAIALPAPKNGPITPDSLAMAIAHSIRENTVIVDEGVTSSRGSSVPIAFDMLVLLPQADKSNPLTRMKMNNSFFIG